MEEYITFKINSVLRDITISLLDPTQNDLPNEFVENVVDKVTRYVMDTEAESGDYPLFYDHSEGEPYLVRYIKFLASSIVDDELDDYKFDLENKDKVVVLDKEKKTMHFGDSEVPAYWYVEGMSEDVVEEKLKEYRDIWKDLEFRENIRYPELEYLYGNGRFEETYKSRMEQELERGTEEGEHLREMLSNRYPEYAIEEEFPDSLKDAVIEKYEGISNEPFHEGYEMYKAKLILKSEEVVQVRLGIHRGYICSVTAIGRRGFPRFTTKDEKLILNRIEEFSKE